MKKEVIMKEDISRNLNSPSRSNPRQALWLSNFKSNILIALKMLGFLSAGFIVWLIAAVIAVKIIIAT